MRMGLSASRFCGGINLPISLRGPFMSMSMTVTHNRHEAARATCRAVNRATARRDVLLVPSLAA